MNYGDCRVEVLLLDTIDRRRIFADGPHVDYKKKEEDDDDDDVDVDLFSMLYHIIIMLLSIQQSERHNRCVPSLPRDSQLGSSSRSRE